ncbi:MAG: hypothetical protein DRN04_16850 [Thermoprotei archaeon]|nr:MAG: hypothetical protein DRN04_16850 [Thermoprotei archaeon]
MVNIGGKEIAEALEKIVETVRNNPDFTIDYLYNAAAILMTIGLTKNIPSLKIIGNYILMVPSRYRPILTYRFQLLGVTEELMKKVDEIAATLDRVLDIIVEIARKIKERKSISDNDFIKYVGEIEDIFSKLPSFRE